MLSFSHHYIFAESWSVFHIRRDQIVYYVSIDERCHLRLDYNTWLNQSSIQTFQHFDYIQDCKYEEIIYYHLMNELMLIVDLCDDNVLSQNLSRMRYELVCNILRNSIGSFVIINVTI